MPLTLNRAEIDFATKLNGAELRRLDSFTRTLRISKIAASKTTHQLQLLQRLLANSVLTPIFINKADRMTPRTAVASTPCYLLKSGSRPISPTIHPDDTKCVCVYGFSDKPIYDQFINDADELLTPYPLVKGYLSNQIESAGSVGDSLQLVILDACTEAQPVLAVATMEAVLAAIQENEKQVSVAYELIFDAETNSYRFS